MDDYYNLEQNDVARDGGRYIELVKTGWRTAQIRLNRKNPETLNFEFVGVLHESQDYASVGIVFDYLRHKPQAWESLVRQ